MTDLVLIEPTTTSVPSRDGSLALLEIALGGTPRGLAVLLCGPDTPEIAVVEDMNHLAGEGYESLATEADVADLPALIGRARERGWDPEQVGMIGLGPGGTTALVAAQQIALGAAVSFSPLPDLSLIRKDPVLRTPWLGLFGAEAEGLSKQEIGELAQILDGGSNVFSQVVTYPGVGREFHRRAESAVSFAASYDSWQRTLEWLNARVASRLTPLANAWRERQEVRSG